MSDSNQNSAFQSVNVSSGLGQSILPIAFDQGLVMGGSMGAFVREFQASQRLVNDAMASAFSMKAVVEALRLSRIEHSLGLTVSEMFKHTEFLKIPQFFDASVISRVDPLGDVRVRIREIEDAGSNLQSVISETWMPGFKAIQEMHRQIAAHSQGAAELNFGFKEKRMLEHLSTLALWRAVVSDEEDEDLEEFLEETEILIKNGGKGEILYETPLSFDRCILTKDFNILLLQEISKNPEKVFQMKPRDFEKLVAEIFYQKGFEVELTPETRDGGLDLIAVRNSDLLGCETVLVECKRYAPHKTVGVGVVRSLLGVIQDSNATRGMIVTTSEFTKGAREFGQKHLNRITLRGHTALMEWIDSLNR